MTEDQVELKGPKGSVSDKLIKLKVDKLEKRPTPGHFDERLSLDPNDDHKIIQEKELPVVKEAVNLLRDAKEEGGLVSNPENPFGEIDSLRMSVFGDLHVYGSYPEESVESRSPVLRKIQDLGPRSRAARESVEIPEHLRSKYKNVEAYMRSGDYVEPVHEAAGFQAAGTDWTHEIRPAFSVQGFREISEAVVSDISNNSEFLQPGSAYAIVDIGDKSNTEAVMGDIALNAIEFEEMRRRTEEVARDAAQKPETPSTVEQYQQAAKERVKRLKGEQVGQVKAPTVYMAAIEGNHDSDINNKGLSNEAIKRELYGSQIFYQEVGADYAVLALNTNFESSFWWDNFELQRKNVDSEEKKEIIRGIEEEIRLQKQLIEKAKASGRKLVVLAHEMELVGNAIPWQKQE